MTWILMIYFGSTSNSHGQQGFSIEFNSLENCKSAYTLYVKNRPERVLGSVSGVCVKK